MIKAVIEDISQSFGAIGVDAPSTPTMNATIFTLSNVDVAQSSGKSIATGDGAATIRLFTVAVACSSMTHAQNGLRVSGDNRNTSPWLELPRSLE